MKAVQRGRQGEDYTADRLTEEGWELLARNYHSRWGEIDLIAAKGEILAFVEVKTRRRGSLDRPAAAVDFRKRERLILTAQQYLLDHPDERQPRFDVAEVVTGFGDVFVVERFCYIAGAFDASGHC